VSFYDYYATEIGDFKEAKKVFERERDVARMGSRLDLRENKEDGSLYLSKHDISGELNHAPVLVYYKDGTIKIDSSIGLRGYETWIDTINRYLPESTLFYNTSGKLFLCYEPGTKVRHNSNRQHNKHIKKVMEIKETTVKMYPDGKVDGVKIVKRGPSTIADPLPLKEHLEKKHFVRMAKARLDNDLEIEYVNRWATFRGIQTGLDHFCIELWSKKESRNGSGPNSGLIRRLHIGRFIDYQDKHMEMNDLAVKIVKDLPISSLKGTLQTLAKEDRGA
jgi:hypothetical protein|tara:strand:+ start:278 stop:1108 length:831 start_codon:yes stop_codon:yes gene_type:complete